MLRNIKIVIFLIIVVFLISGCSGKSEVNNTSQRDIKKKPAVKKEEVKKVVIEETENEDLENDFKEEEDGNESELAKDFEENEDKALDIDDDETELDNEDEDNSAVRIKKITVQPELIRGDSDIEIFVHLIPGLRTNESILINFLKGGSIELANTSDLVIKKELFKKGDVVSFEIMLVRDDNIIEERRLAPTLVANSNPKITVMPSISTRAYKVYTYDVKAEDIDGDSITFELEGDVPSGMQIDGFTGRITYNFNNPPQNEKYVFNIVARDTDGGEDVREVSLVFKKKIVNQG